MSISAQDPTMLTEIKKLELEIRSGQQPAIVNMKDGLYRTLPNVFRNKGQHDVCDLFMCLMDSLSAPELNASRSEQNFTNTVFTGATQETFQCTVCSHREVRDPVNFNIVMLPVNENQSSISVSLNELFSRFTSSGMLPDLNCTGCRMNNMITSTTAFTTAPPSLMVQLMRFDNTLTKQFRPVSFPQNFILPGVAASYSLVAVTRHLSSSFDHGHYVADVKEDDGSWWSCNDELVTPCLYPTAIGTIDNTPYLLHYEKRPS